MSAFYRIARLFGLGASLMLPVSRGYAQSVLEMLGNNLKYAGGDAWGVWTSPLNANHQEWLAALGVVGAATMLSPMDDDVDRWAYRHRNDRGLRFLKPVRGGGILFSGKTITPVVLSAVVVSLATKNEPMQDGLFGCATAYGSSSLVRTYVFYPLVARTRPEPRDPNGPAPPADDGDQYAFGVPGSRNWGQHSLPGGHLANITACASFLTHRYDWGSGESLVWGAVGGVALARTLDRGHWASDELLGFAFGYAIGRVVAIRSLKRAASRASDRATRPIGSASDAVRIGWSTSFD